MRVLFVRTSAMGDIVHCLPTLVALRRAVPEARVGWVVESTWAPILEGHPDIEQLIRVRTKAWRRGVRRTETRGEIRAAVAAMRAFRADVALDLMGNHKGAILTRLAGAKRSVGASRRERREPSSALWLRETHPVGGEHAVDRALGLLAPLGVEPGPADFGGDRLLADEPSAASALLATRRGGRPLVLLQLGAGWANKIYPMDRWTEVARGLEQAGAEVWIPTAPGEEHLAMEVEGASEGAARAVDATDFAVLAALMRRASLLIGGDTGPVHLAHALGTPVLSLIGPTDPKRNGPYAAAEQVLFHELPCSYCYKRFDGPRACLLQITVDEVLERALEQLGAAEDINSKGRIQ